MLACAYYAFKITHYALEQCSRNLPISYCIREFLRTINFAVFVDFTATFKINPQKSYHSLQML